jgi:hypothetical protein
MALYSHPWHPSAKSITMLCLDDGAQIRHGSAAVQHQLRAQNGKVEQWRDKRSGFAQPAIRPLQML